ncbi:hypothetical protein GGE65_007680 [Skermanella aerolata]|uniref:hypothetical protein n=1 Tax=Skermanella aerolata TaxID=393310 RepID=UPI003D2429C4
MTPRKPRRRPIRTDSLLNLQQIIDAAAERDAAAETPPFPSLSETEKSRGL